MSFFGYVELRYNIYVIFRGKGVSGATSIKRLALLLSAGVRCMGVRAEETDATQLEAVVVTAPLPQKVSDAARPVTVLTEDELVSRAGNTIGQTLQQEPGMNSRAFGPGVGSPVIRGQAGPRVRVMQNGIGNNDVSALSPDHANSLEPMQADRIEVLRGPATLLYGSCAIGGVVNVIDNRVPSRMRERLMGGAFEQSYNSVSDETASNLKLEGGKDSIAYHVDGFYREQGNTHSPPTSA